MEPDSASDLVESYQERALQTSSDHQAEAHVHRLILHLPATEKIVNFFDSDSIAHLTTPQLSPHPFRSHSLKSVFIRDAFIHAAFIRAASALPILTGHDSR